MFLKFYNFDLITLSKLLALFSNLEIFLSSLFHKWLMHFLKRKSGYVCLKPCLYYVTYLLPLLSTTDYVHFIVRLLVPYLHISLPNECRSRVRRLPEPFPHQHN